MPARAAAIADAAPGARAEGALTPPVTRLLALLALAKLLIHLPALTQYGYFRDELYYLASTEHLALGYVDHPPLSIAVLAAVRALLGDSLPALRLVPLAAGIGCLVLAGLLARELGGGRAAQGLAALGVLAAPAYLGTHHYYSMNALDQLAWASAALITARLLKTGSTRGWLVLGAVLGLGLLNKISVLWLGLGLAAGLLIGGHRRRLLTPAPWLGVVVAAALFAPHIAWQVVHDWPTQEFIRNATQEKMTHGSVGGFIKEQILTMNPATAPVWITGLIWSLWPKGRRSGRAADDQVRTARLFGVTWLAVFALLAFSGTARASYLAPAYPMLLAPGAVALEAFARSRSGARPGVVRRAAIPVISAAMIVMGMLIAPFALPLLPPDTFLAYMHTLGATPPTEERHAQADLPQHYADMFGWDEMAQKMAAAWNALPPEDRARGAVFAQNYGEAGAIDVLGRRLGLPPAISGHNSYWLWGPPHPAPEVVVILGGDEEDNAAFFEELTRVDTLTCARCMPYEQGLGIYVGRRPKAPLSQAWPSLKHFI